MSDTSHPPGRTSPWELNTGPAPEHWDDWTELDPAAWPERRERHYSCIPTICFNCESGCGLLAYVDKETGEIAKLEGNPVHPGSRGRTCAKGPATINQIKDTERILKPMKRVGPRGSGRFEEVRWEDVLEDLGARIGRAFDEGRHDEVMYHVGRPGDDHFVPRMLSAWGIDGHNSHTNVCSAAARLGYALWFGADRPSPDYERTKFALLLSAHLETGHYFNPHAQRIIAAKEGGTRIAVIDTRLSNTSTHADHWVSTWPGSESALLLGITRELLLSGRYDEPFMRRWLNWRETLAACDPDGAGTFERFLEVLKERYASFTPEFVQHECRIPAGTVETLANEIAAAGSQFTSHLWRNTASGHLGGWQVARCLLLLHALTGSIGTPGGLNPNSWDKFVPKPSTMPPPIKRWNELIWPRGWPLAHYEMSFLLPHLLEDQNKHIDVYFSRVYNPVWTNPDGCKWIEMLEDESRIGCHVALTPIWSETAQWADYVLPMGLGPERHDIMSQETHAGTWVGFRQPVQRVFKGADTTLGSNPGQVWEEAEFWVALTWKLDPDGSRGIRQYFESKSEPGQPISMDEYYADIFENAVPGLPESAEKAGLTPLAYMRRYGAFDVPYAGQERYEREAKDDAPGADLGDGGRKEGFKTPSRKLEFYSQTLADWGHPEEAMPGYIRSQVHWSHMDVAAGDLALLPTFRLPTLIHTRSGNAKWLQEISHTNPLWLHPEDAQRLQLTTGDLARVNTRIGFFVGRVWVTEGIHPGVVACSHHVGRWRLFEQSGGDRRSTAHVGLERTSEGIYKFRQQAPVGPYASSDPDSSRIWWQETGVNQNLTFPVQPDPISGMHCWHQLVRVELAHEGDQFGDIEVDVRKSRKVYEEWLAQAKPAPGPDNLRRPLWLNRPLHPAESAYRIET